MTIAFGQNLQRCKDTARNEIDVRSDLLRSGEFSKIRGQDLIYEKKEAQARAWLAIQGNKPTTLDDYPMLRAEIAAGGAATADEAAQRIINRATALERLAELLETIRLRANYSIARATTVREVHQALALFNKEADALHIAIPQPLPIGVMHGPSTRGNPNA